MYITVNNVSDKNSIGEITIINNKAARNIFFLGSCRVIPLLNYFINDPNFKNSYNFLCVLVHVEKIKAISHNLNKNKKLCTQIRNTDILICEYMINYNYFNTSRTSSINIYQIHNSFNKAIILPNYHDHCIYSKEIVKYMIPVEFKQFIDKRISFDEIKEIMKSIHDKEINRYYAIIEKSDFPELLPFIKANLYTTRLAYTINHPTNCIFMEIYTILLRKFFGLNVTQEVIKINDIPFLNSGIDTALTYYDKCCLGFTVDEPYLDVYESDKYLCDV